MPETTLEVRIPTPLLQFGLDQKEIQQRVREWLVLSLFTEGHISSGRAARLLEISRIEFLALLRAQKIAYVDYTSEELADEFATIKSMRKPFIMKQLSPDAKWAVRNVKYLHPDG